MSATPSDHPSSHSSNRATDSTVVRDANPIDMIRVQAIYGHEVTEGIATFEEVPPTVDELHKRYAAVLKNGLPYLVAEIESVVVGYSYATPFHHRAAYRHSIENAVYIDPAFHGRGIGRALLTRLIERCEAGPFRQMFAVIGDSDNAGSIGLHTACGFRLIGTLHGSGFKHGRWVDTIMMQRTLGDGMTSPPK